MCVWSPECVQLTCSCTCGHWDALGSVSVQEIIALLVSGQLEDIVWGESLDWGSNVGMCWLC